MKRGMKKVKKEKNKKEGGDWADLIWCDWTRGQRKEGDGGESSLFEAFCLLCIFLFPCFPFFGAFFFVHIDVAMANGGPSPLHQQGNVRERVSVCAHLFFYAYRLLPQICRDMHIKYM